MRAAVVCLALLVCALRFTPSAAGSVWITPSCVGCCSYSTAVGSTLVVALRADRVNGTTSSPVSIAAAEDPGVPIGSLVQPQVSNNTHALAVFMFTPLPLHKNLSMTVLFNTAHDNTTSSLCLRVTVLAPNPFYAADSLNVSTSLAAAVNCPVTITVAVEDAYYACDIRVSRMRAVSSTGSVSLSIPNHIQKRATSQRRASLTLEFVPAFGSESSQYTACFMGSDAIGMQMLAEVCVTWVVSKCEYCSGSGETLQYIAQLYAGDSNWRRLFNMNPSLVDPDLIFTNNKRLVVGNLYRVARGDTLVGLSQRFACSLPSLLRLNPDVSDPSNIFLGQLLCVAPYTALGESAAVLGAKTSISSAV